MYCDIKWHLFLDRHSKAPLSLVLSRPFCLHEANFATSTATMNSRCRYFFKRYEIHAEWIENMVLNYALLKEGPFVLNISDFFQISYFCLVDEMMRFKGVCVAWHAVGDKLNQRYDFILIDRLFTIFAIGLVKPMNEMTKPMIRYTLNCLE